MNEQPLDESYFVWLYSQVASPKLRNPSKTYWSLFRQLYKTEFVWFIPNDDNRVEDGRELRYEFLDENGLDRNDREWMGLGCSMLEMLIGLARRLTFQVDGETSGWFWWLLENLGLEVYNDHVRGYEERIDEIVQKVIWRNYAKTGRGGLFPLKHPKEDQRKVEIWYQMSAYLLERYEEGGMDGFL